VDMASPGAVAVVQVAIAAAEFNAPRRLLVEMTSVPRLMVQLDKSIYFNEHQLAVMCCSRKLNSPLPELERD